MRPFPLVCTLLVLLATTKISFGQTKDSSTVLRIRSTFPTYLRPGDAVELQAVVISNDSAEKTGQAILQLTDSMKNTPVDGWFNNIFPAQYFTAAPQTEAELRFPVAVPVQFTSQLKWLLTISSDSLQQQATGNIAIRPNATVTALPRGFVLKKQFFQISNGKASAQPVTEYTALKQTDTVQVLLTITLPKTLQTVTITDDAPAVLHTTGHPLNAGKKISFQPTPGGIRLLLPSLAAGTHYIRYHAVASYIGTFSSGYLKLEAGNLAAPLVTVSQTSLQVTE